METVEAAKDHHAYNARITPFVVISCAVAASGGILFGYDLGISGGVTSMDPFLEKFFPAVHANMSGAGAHASNYCKFDSQLLTAFTSSLYIAGFFSSLCASPVTQALGRRASMLLGGAFFTAGAILGGLAADVYMLILGRVLLGVGLGFTNQSVPLYLSEMAPPQHRGAINNAFDLFVGLGVLSANLVNYGVNKLHVNWGWRLSLSAALLPAAVLSLGALFLPDTPNSVLLRRLHNSNSSPEDSARILLQKIRGTADVEAELQDMLAAASSASTKSTSSILARKFRPQLVMAVLIPFFKQMTGINVVGFYAPVIFRTIGLSESFSLLSAVLTGVISTAFIAVGMLIVDRVGRRVLFVVGGVLMLATHVVVGGVLWTQLKDHGAMDSGYAYWVLGSICVYVAGFGVSWGPLGWLVPSEIFTLEVRSTGQSVVVAVGMAGAAVMGQTLLAMLCRMRAGVFFFFAGWLAVMTAFVVALVPETKGVPIERMEVVWRGHWFWRKMVVEEEKEAR
ncbi:hypothetical protein ZIOFF_070443 [Zingiber officinale]|uniref:Major facilitator superfamily (MFS) profile domain-containing protein n=2 Tax=Zingiber officinale TaxID=94328 RepID=A0A8J5C542_ZINOF|nr:hypothetical protein ZIOFF_070443 [Zingiber officinale]